MDLEGIPSSLKKIGIRNNYITKINWKHSKRLKDIDISFNQISDLNWSESPKKLKRLDLEGNQISELNWYESPKNLKSIDLDRNNITKFIWDFVPDRLRYINPGELLADYVKDSYIKYRSSRRIQRSYRIHLNKRNKAAKIIQIKDGSFGLNCLLAKKLCI